MSAICVGDTGTWIVVTVKDKMTDEIQDLSNATSIEVTFKKPDGEVVETTAALYTDGEDGKFLYVVEEDGDLQFDQAGRYRMQARVITDSGSFGTDIQTFKVHPNLD